MTERGSPARIKPSPAEAICDFWSGSLSQGALEVLDEVVGIFDAHRQPHHSVDNATVFANFLGNGSVGHGRRVSDQGFYAAKAFSQRKQFGSLKQFLCSFQSALYYNGYHARISVHLFFRKLMLWVGRQSGVDDLFDARVFF